MWGRRGLGVGLAGVGVGVGVGDGVVGVQLSVIMPVVGSVTAVQVPVTDTPDGRPVMEMVCAAAWPATATHAPVDGQREKSTGRVWSRIHSATPITSDGDMPAA